MLYFIAAGVLLVMVVVVRLLMVSRYGELLVAVRDQENRVRFLGYDPANVKVVAYAIAACFAGIGGALFAPVVGIISPADVGVVPSIGFLVGVAIGGRATLLGPVLGAIAVSWAETGLSEQFPSFWTYFQGALFILVVAFLPRASRPWAAVASAPTPAPPREPDGPGRRTEPGRDRETAGTTDMTDARRPHDRRTPRSASRSLDPRRGSSRSSPHADARFRHDYLEIRDLRVVFDGFVAVDGVDLDGRRTATCGSSSAPTAPARRRSSTRSPGWRPPPGSVQFGGVDLLGQAVAPDRPRRRRAHVPDRERVRRADRAAEPRHRRGRRPRPRDDAAPPHGRPDAEVEAALETVGLTHVARPARRGSSRTGRSSGWRSGCCWCRTPGCCCSTSRWPA